MERKIEACRGGDTRIERRRIGRRQTDKQTGGQARISSQPAIETGRHIQETQQARTIKARHLPSAIS